MAGLLDKDATADGVGYVYLDWAATTPLCEEASEVMVPYLIGGPGNIAFGANANSLHTPGRGAFNALEEARRDIACALGAARPDEIIFTSGATEADNAALFGLIGAAVRRTRQKGQGGFRPHFITSSIEHDAVLSALPKLREEGCDVTVIDPDANGFVSVETLRAALQENTVLVSIMAANNEVGSVQDVSALCACAHEAGALFHTDATQALGKVLLDMGKLGVDAASFSGHKICGPKGIGALYLRAHTPFVPFLLGGGQEGGRRSGTQNVCGAAGFAAAFDAACENLAQESARQRSLRDALYARLTALDGVRATVEVPVGSERFLPNIVNVLSPGFESETLILRLDIAGFAVSGGSACSSHSLDPSHVLSALGVPKDDALCSLRVSIGRYTAAEDLNAFAQAYAAAIGRS